MSDAAGPTDRFVIVAEGNTALVTPHSLEISDETAANSFTEEQIAEFKEAWDLVCPATQDSLSIEESRKVCSSLGQDPTVARRQKILPGAPPNPVAAKRKGERVTFNELLAYLSASMRDYDGSVCTLCESIYSQLPGWNKHECERQQGFCSVFGDAAGAALPTNLCTLGQVESGLRAIVEHGLFAAPGFHETCCSRISARLGDGSSATSGSSERISAEVAQLLIEGVILGEV
jgi:hypothetical protein